MKRRIANELLNILLVTCVWNGWMCGRTCLELTLVSDKDRYSRRFFSQFT